jgi:hypothetical protein
MEATPDKEVLDRAAEADTRMSSETTAGQKGAVAVVVA